MLNIFLGSDVERREWIKPIMFSGGIGSIDNKDTKKENPETGNIFLLLNKFNSCVFIGFIYII